VVITSRKRWADVEDKRSFFVLFFQQRGVNDGLLDR